MTTEQGKRELLSAAFLRSLPGHQGTCIVDLDDSVTAKIHARLNPGSDDTLGIAHLTVAVEDRVAILRLFQYSDRFRIDLVSQGEKSGGQQYRTLMDLHFKSPKGLWEPIFAEDIVKNGGPYIRDTRGRFESLEWAIAQCAILPQAIRNLHSNS